MRLEELKEAQKSLIKYIYEALNEEVLKEFLFFSYLGARICYASTHPLSLFEEDKFKNYDRFKSFLLHLKKAGHYSVFAHSPVWVDLSRVPLEIRFKIATSFFKVFWDNKGEKAIFNLRHLAENISETEFEKLIEVKPDLNNIFIKIIRNKEKLFEGYFNELNESVLTPCINDVFIEKEVIIIENKKIREFRWIGVIAHNFSRIFSHQFVRHTWLNFNQRSHRYTDVDYFVLPEVFSEEDREIYSRIIKQSMSAYEELKKKMKKEWARFIVPQGVATTVLATGPELVWNDFISKRAIPQAQSEIRYLAEVLKAELF
ncbi:MAG: FAD-dependent thymidylate synthase [Thermodesulfobacteria bacterium]|nr:FAD-dependent thymidylate synthase [Thermodesulfobacteriota bacterium]